MDIYFGLYSFPQQDKALINKIVYGTIEYTIQLDYFISQYSSVKPEKIKKPILYILRMSVYQIRFMDGIPEYSVCNEAVKLAKKRKLMNLSGFVNGVLRSISREKDKLTLPQTTNPIDDLSIRYSCPKWLIEYLLKQYDEGTVIQILRNSLTEAPLTIRPNFMKTSKGELIKQLQKEGVGVTEGSLTKVALNIELPGKLWDLQSFREGLFQVQDESSMLVGEVAKPKEGQFILDACAAPGGKSTHLAELLKGTGKVFSRDLTPKKIQLIQDNLKRLGHNNIQTECFDATVIDEKLIGEMDIVLTDVPCSGLGILRKKPDIKYNISPEGIKSLISLQHQIMDTCSNYVRVGGLYIYSTCTLNQAENIDNVKWFLENHPTFERCPIEEIPCKEDGIIELLPEDGGHDGFFIAKMKRMA